MADTASHFISTQRPLLPKLSVACFAPRQTAASGVNPSPSSKAEDVSGLERVAHVRKAPNTDPAFLNRKVTFNYDRDSNQVIIKVVDKQSEEVIRQFPPEELLAVQHNLREQLEGFLLNQKA